MGDRVAVLNAGQIEQCDRPRDLYDRPANLFVAAFIGSPSMNFFTATVERRDGGLVAVVGRGRDPARPEPTSSTTSTRWVGPHDHGRRARRVDHAPTPRREGSPQPRRHRRVRRGARLRGDRARQVAGLGSSLEIASTLQSRLATSGRSLPTRQQPRDQAAGPRRRAGRATPSRCTSTRRASTASIPPGPSLRKGARLSERRSDRPARHRRRHRRHIDQGRGDRRVGTVVASTPSADAAAAPTVSWRLRCGRCRRRRRDAAAISVSDVDAVGVGIPGTVDPAARHGAPRGQRRHRARRRRRSARASPPSSASPCTSRTTCAPRRSAPTGTSADQGRRGRRPRLPQHRHRHRRRLRRTRPVAARQHVGGRRDRPHPDRSAGPAVRVRPGRLHRGDRVGCGHRADVADARRCAGSRPASRPRSAATPLRERCGHGVVGGLSRAVLLLALTWDPAGHRAQRRRRGARRRAARRHRRAARRRRRDSPSSSARSTSAQRMRVIDPSVPLGPIGAVRAAHAARPVLARHDVARRPRRQSCTSTRNVSTRTWPSTARSSLPSARGSRRPRRPGSSTRRGARCCPASSTSRSTARSASI